MTTRLLDVAQSFTNYKIGYEVESFSEILLDENYEDIMLFELDYRIDLLRNEQQSLESHESQEDNNV